jgi:hypothetical protein
MSSIGIGNIARAFLATQLLRARSKVHTLSSARTVDVARQGSTKQDDMIIVEVMVKRFDRTWWRRYRRYLENSFRQEEIVVRVHEVIRI